MLFEQISFGPVRPQGPSIGQGLASNLTKLKGSEQEAKGKLKELAEKLRQIDIQEGGGHTAAADIIYIYACTQCWFSPGRGYKVLPPHAPLPLLPCSARGGAHSFLMPWPFCPMV